MSKLLDTAPGVRERGLRSQRIPEPARGERWGSSSLHRGRGHVEELRMEWEPAGWIYPGLEGGNRGELRLGPSGRRVLGLLAGNLAWWSLWLGALRGFLWEIRLVFSMLENVSQQFLPLMNIWRGWIPSKPTQLQGLPEIFELFAFCG